MKILLIVLGLMFLTGCATPTKGKIFFEGKTVHYELGEAGKMYYKDDKVETFYDTQTPSLLRDIIGATAVKEINKN